MPFLNKDKRSKRSRSQRRSKSQERKQQRKQSQTRRRKQQRGGDGQGNRGHDVSFPSEFFGTSSGAYFPEGSAELGPYQTAYNTAPADGCSTFGNNIAPGGASVPSSGIQTGGARRRIRRSVQVKDKQSKNQRQQKQHSEQQHTKQRKSKQSRQQKKKGGLWNQLVSEASKLIVPVGLYAAKEFAEGKLKKPSSRRSSTKKSSSSKRKSA